ncbi:uncharacterized protein LOC132401556 [Hypanus sabinus]|uniref:uncharacterized protein LOC132401556 n=1 Tax=Hypanus sabinus TaxID=79690 RepID=UPI0028C37E82|nr:uncharacterized protein LOC132401556 [Hypanus sabinus]
MTPSATRHRVIDKRVRNARKALGRIESSEIIAVGSEISYSIQMIMPTNWVSYFFIIFGACMILAFITCYLFHLRKNRSQKKEITDWVNSMKHSSVVYHPLLHWIKNNSDLSIKTKAYSSGNEQCKKLKIWKAQTALPSKYKKKPRNPGASNHRAGYSHNPQIGNKCFPKSPVDVASGEARWIHSQPEKPNTFLFPKVQNPSRKSCQPLLL